MTKVYSKEELAHIGILGMHWGHHKSGDGSSGESDNSISGLKKTARKKFQNDLAELHKSGKGNNDAEVINAAKKHDAEMATIKETEKAIKVSIGKTSKPHADEVIAEMTWNKDMSRVGGAELDFAINRVAGVNSAKQAIKKGWVKPPSKNIHEMSNSELDVITENPEVKRKAKEHMDTQIKRARLIVGSLLVAGAFTLKMLDVNNKATALNSFYGEINK